MRCIEWYIISGVIIGVPWFYVSAKDMWFRKRPKNPIASMFGVLIGFMYLVMPALMVIYFHYTGVVQ